MNKEQILLSIFHKSEPFYTEFKNIITYHSSKIEGSTLSLEDNKNLIILSALNPQYLIGLKPFLTSLSSILINF